MAPARGFAALLVALLFAASAVVPAVARAGEARIAVAANFTAPARDIATAFEAASGHGAVLSFGSTGKLYTQIAHGAPYDVFLAADAERPQRAVAEGLAVAGSRFTYAVGGLVLYSTDPGLIADGAAVLERPDAFARLAIANPKTAPYGVAALETMARLGVLDRIRGKIVRGENIAQTYQFVATGNAQLGFIAQAQAVATEGGSSWPVPGQYHRPIAQDAVLLAGGADNDAARAFLDFLAGPEARAIIARYGYAAE